MGRCHERCWRSVAAALGAAVLAPGVATGATPPPSGGAVVSRRGVEGLLVVHAMWNPRDPHDTRRLFVLLPPSYTERDERQYPLLCALDGQDLFDPALAPGGEEWTLDEILARRPQGVPELLVVGVEAGADALHEQAPPGASDGARGDSMLAYLTDSVLPFVAAHYRVQRRRADTVVLGCGSSALFAVYVAWQRSDVFGGAIALGCPDVAAGAIRWTATPPQGGRPWLWFEQRAAETPRPSNTDLVAALQRHADVEVVVAGPQSSRTQRVLAGLRGWGRH